MNSMSTVYVDMRAESNYALHESNEIVFKQYIDTDISYNECNRIYSYI
jgi:hypothetical protein